MAAPPGTWHDVQTALFERGVAEAIFKNASQLMVGTVVAAAGLRAWQRTDEAFGVLSTKAAGGTVIAIGAALIVLNLLHGLHGLGKAKHPLVLRVLFSVAYVFAVFRLTQFVIAFRFS